MVVDGSESILGGDGSILGGQFIVTFSLFDLFNWRLTDLIFLKSLLYKMCKLEKSGAPQKFWAPNPNEKKTIKHATSSAM